MLLSFLRCFGGFLLELSFESLGIEPSINCCLSKNTFVIGNLHSSSVGRSVLIPLGLGIEGRVERINGTSGNSRDGLAGSSIACGFRSGLNGSVLGSDGNGDGGEGEGESHDL